MPEVPALTATVDWADGVAAVTVRGQLDAATRSQLRECVAWIAENSPQRLVLDLHEVIDHMSEPVGTLIAAVRRQLPAGCFLDVRLDRPAGHSAARFIGPVRDRGRHDPAVLTADSRGRRAGGLRH
jgi:hypothetical protein